VKSKSIQLTTLIFFLIFSIQALAAGGDPNIIPWGFIGVQVLNFSITMFLLVFFLKKPAKQLFASRYAEYNKKLAESQKALTDAQEKKNHIVDTIDNFRKTKGETLKRAEHDSTELKNKMIAEAESSANRIKADSETKIKIELASAKASLMDELLDRSVETAKDKMKQEIKPDDYTRLKGEFVDKVQVVSAQ